MSTKKQQQIDWRRSQVLELSTKGYSQSDIARILQVDMSVICRDVIFLKQQSRDNIRKYIDEKLSEEYEKCVVGLNAITKESYDAAHNTENKEKRYKL
jgi:transposase